MPESVATGTLAEVGTPGGTTAAGVPGVVAPLALLVLGAAAALSRRRR